MRAVIAFLTLFLLALAVLSLFPRTRPSVSFSASPEEPLPVPTGWFSGHIYWDETGERTAECRVSLEVRWAGTETSYGSTAVTDKNGYWTVPAATLFPARQMPCRITKVRARVCGVEYRRNGIWRRADIILPGEWYGDHGFLDGEMRLARGTTIDYRTPLQRRMMGRNYKSKFEH